MAFAKTTLSAAVAATDTQITVASATSVAAGRLIRVDQEMMQVGASYSSGTTVPVLRGRQGTKTDAHVSGANAVHGLASDFAEAGQGGPSIPYQQQRAVQVSSISATGTLAQSPAGTDQRVILNGTSVIALTVAVPTKDKDGDLLHIISNGAAAHTLTFTGGVSGAGSSYDVITVNATAPSSFLFVAANELWMPVCGPAMGGTVTNIIGSIA